MGDFLLVILVAAIGGAVVALQAQFIGILDRQLGTLVSVFITYASGGLVILVLFFGLGGADWRAWRVVPWYAFSTGLLGLAIIGALSYSVSRLGLVATFTVLMASQFIVAALFDHFGLLGSVIRPLDVSRIIGVIVLLGGVWLIIR
jgi:transporter family-2 protein